MRPIIWLLPVVNALRAIGNFEQQVVSASHDVVVSVGGCFESTLDRLVGRSDVDGFRAERLPHPFDNFVTTHGLAVFPAHLRMPYAVGCGYLPSPLHALAFVSNAFSHERNKWDALRVALSCCAAEH